MVSKNRTRRYAEREEEEIRDEPNSKTKMANKKTYLDGKMVMYWEKARVKEQRVTKKPCEKKKRFEHGGQFRIDSRRDDILNLDPLRPKVSDADRGPQGYRV